MAEVTVSDAAQVLASLSSLLCFNKVLLLRYVTVWISAELSVGEPLHSWRSLTDLCAWITTCSGSLKIYLWQKSLHFLPESSWKYINHSNESSADRHLLGETWEEKALTLDKLQKPVSDYTKNTQPKIEI